MEDSPQVHGPGPVVFIDDDPADRELVERCFRRSRLSLRREFLALESSDALLEYLDAAAIGKEEVPSILLLDIRMPAPDGIETLEILRERAARQAIPAVVMLTNSNLKAAMDEAASLGARGFQTKPYRVQQFVDFLDGLVPGDE